ncbi:MAG: hypothetical protein OEZ13_01605 [Spirochaetia bacterium]|nr:hypothetical protein [Spirochaetia bacterium]
MSCPIFGDELEKLMLEVKIPEKVSDLRGWYGLTLSYEGLFSNKCKITFPKNFGNKKKEIYIIIKLINLRFIIEENVCSINLERDGLDHLKYLALEKHNGYAAWAILFPLEHQGFNLEGHYMDIYDTDYLLPVFNQFQQIKGLLNSYDRRRMLLINVCFSTQLSSDETVSLQDTVSRLIERGVKDYASLLYEKCSELLRVNLKIPE